MTTGTPSQFEDLRSLLCRKKHDPFLDGFIAAFQEEGLDKDVLRVLGGEGLALFLRTMDSASDETCLRYVEQLNLRNIHPAPGDIERVVESLLPRLERYLDTAKIADTLRSLISLAAFEERNRVVRRPMTNVPRPVQLKRFVQVIDFKVGRFPDSHPLGLKQSVFKSPQERSFLRALSLRFPGLMAIPNYGLNQLFDSELLREMVDPATLNYALRCVLDAVLIVPDEGDPVAAFELDSRWHDSPERAHLDDMKNRLLELIQIPLVRLRVVDSPSINVDEWYALLTDQVVDRISCGTRITTRHDRVSLVPVEARR